MLKGQGVNIVIYDLISNNTLIGMFIFLFFLCSLIFIIINEINYYIKYPKSKKNLSFIITLVSGCAILLYMWYGYDYMHIMLSILVLMLISMICYFFFFFFWKKYIQKNKF